MASEASKTKDTELVPSHRTSELEGGTGHHLVLNFKKKGGECGSAKGR